MFDPNTIFGGFIGAIRDFSGSRLFSFVKLLLGVYTLVLLADIIMLLILRGVGGNIRTTFQGINVPALPKKKWQNVKSRIDQNNPSQYKVAILEADKIVDDIIKGMGYKGENMLDRLNQPGAVHIENADELKRAHQVRNRIIHETDFQVDRKTAEEIIGVYEKFLRQSEFLD